MFFRRLWTLVQNAVFCLRIQKYFYSNTLQPIPVDVLTANLQQFQILGALRLQVQIRSAKIIWSVLVMLYLGCACILDSDFLNFPGTEVDFAEKSFSLRIEMPPHTVRHLYQLLIGIIIVLMMGKIRT